MITIFATIMCIFRLVDIYQGGAYFEALGKEGSLILFLILGLFNTSFLWTTLKNDFKLVKELLKIIEQNIEG